MLFCSCGTLLTIENKSIIICSRCKKEHSSSIFKPTITKKDYEPKADIKFLKAKGAKIKYKCNNCGNEEMRYNTIQTRSADEGQTVFYECDCGYKEKIFS
ncbi:DNA-directed RNA polymerase I core subunit rpa12 [Gurleya vavrai]